eukprot:2469748-Rhodomonas_salina.1
MLRDQAHASALFRSRRGVVLRGHALLRELRREREHALGCVRQAVHVLEHRADGEVLGRERKQEHRRPHLRVARKHRAHREGHLWPAPRLGHALEVEDQRLCDVGVHARGSVSAQHARGGAVVRPHRDALVVWLVHPLLPQLVVEHALQCHARVHVRARELEDAVWEGRVGSERQQAAEEDAFRGAPLVAARDCAAVEARVEELVQRTLRVSVCVDHQHAPKRLVVLLAPQLPRMQLAELNVQVAVLGGLWN